MKTILTSCDDKNNRCKNEHVHAGSDMNQPSKPKNEHKNMNILKYFNVPNRSHVKTHQDVIFYIVD